jgi:DNA mismatch repair protein MutH
MNYEGKAEQLLLGGQSQTEVPYSTEEQRLAAAQVLALLALAEAIKDLSASIDMGLRGDGGSGIGKAIESALGMANTRHQPGLVNAIEHLAT